MANVNNCGCSGRRNGYGCLGCLGDRYRCGNYPYYGGPCPDVDGCYGEAYRERCVRRPGGCFGMFSAMLPMAVAANGIIPLVGNNCMSNVKDFPVNSGLITVEEKGTYLASYTVRLPEGAALDSTITLNVNDASQSSAITNVGGEGPAGFTAQAIFDVADRATVALRSSEPINLTDSSAQPLVTLSLVRLDEE